MSKILDKRGMPIPDMTNTYYERTTRRKQQAGYRSQPLPEDQLIGTRSLEMMRLEALDQARSNPIVSSLSSRIADNVVGPQGIRPQAKTSDNTWNETAEDFWNDWSRSPDHRGRLNMREMQKLVVQARLFMGDMLPLFTQNGKIQPIEADRIGTPNDFKDDKRVIEGVRLNAEGQTLGHYILRRDDRGRIDRNKYDYRQVAAGRLVACPELRFEKVRSTPEIYPICKTLIDFDELQEAQLIKAKMDAATGHVITKEGGASAMPNPMSTPRGGSGGTGPIYETFDFGANYYLNPGEKIDSFASATPNPQYVQYCEMVLRLIASATRIPYDFLLLDFKKGSFSASRAAQQAVVRSFEMYGAWIIEEFLQRVWEWRIAMAIRDGEIPPAPTMPNGRSSWYKVEWSLPEMQFGNPKDTATANESGFRLGNLSLTQINRRAGTTTDATLGEKGDDIIVAIKESQRIKTETGVDVDWRELIQVTKPGEVVKQDNEQIELELDDDQ